MSLLAEPPLGGLGGGKGQSLLVTCYDWLRHSNPKEIIMVEALLPFLPTFSTGSQLTAALVLGTASQRLSKAPRQYERLRRSIT